MEFVRFDVDYIDEDGGVHDGGIDMSLSEALKEAKGVLNKERERGGKALTARIYQVQCQHVLSCTIHGEFKVEWRFA